MITLELIPLLINSVTSLILLYFYIQIPAFNTAIYLFIVEVYTYFVLCYGMVRIVIKQDTTRKGTIITPMYQSVL